MNKIADVLNSEHIPTPMDYQYKRIGKNDPHDYTHIWASSNVKLILNNPIYIGTLAQHRSTSVSYKNHKRVHYDPSEWSVVEDAFEQILRPFDVIRIANTTLIYTAEEIIYNEAASTGTPEQKFNYQNRSVVMSVNINEVRVKKYHSLKKKTLLRDINLDIEAGDFILILGGSGAGKTTFLKALLGEHRANGSIMLDGMDLYKNFKALKRKIGIVPQFSITRDNDTVLHTITDAAESKLSGGDYTKAEIQQRIDDIISKMMLTSLKNSLIKNLSGGQKKRVEVAVQAIGDQQIFILDEPDSGMDYASRVDLMRNLKSCTESGGVVTVISHAPDDAADMFTKVIVLAKSKTDEIGRLAYYGDIQNALKFFGVKRLTDIIIEINYEGGKGRGDEFVRKFENTRRG